MRKHLCLLLLSLLALCLPVLGEANTAVLTIAKAGCPDGWVDQAYNYVIPVKGGAAPYKITVLKGQMPPGLTANAGTGAIEGTPGQSGFWAFTLQLVDAKKKTGKFSGAIAIHRLITVGAHGTLNGEDGLQMALNMAGDCDVIRVEQGRYEVAGFGVPGSKSWPHGIEISGGWEETFNKQSGETSLTTLDEAPILTIAGAAGAIRFDRLGFTGGPAGAVLINSDCKIEFSGCSFTDNGSYGALEGAVLIWSPCTVAFTDCDFTRNRNGAVYVGVKSKVSFTRCAFTDNESGVYGGAVHAKENVTFQSCSFTNNTSAGMAGGAVACTDLKKGDFVDCKFVGNHAETEGGGVYAGRDSQFRNCVFEANTANYRAGAVYVDAGSFIACTFRDNQAGTGGAVETGRTTKFLDCTFAGNKAGGNGGAVAIFGGDWDEEGAFNRCRFSGNAAGGNGGAVSGVGYFCNCLFYDNTAEGNGGAFSGTGALIHCTLTRNRANEGGGGIGAAGLSVTSSILFGNIAGEKPNDIAADGGLIIDYCLVGKVQGAADYGPHNIMGDPRFVDPAGNDFRLGPDSPCIDKGWPLQEVALWPDLAVDLDKSDRMAGKQVDIGAFEYQG